MGRVLSDKTVSTLHSTFFSSDLIKWILPWILTPLGFTSHTLSLEETKTIFPTNKQKTYQNLKSTKKFFFHFQNGFCCSRPYRTLLTTPYSALQQYQKPETEKLLWTLLELIRNICSIENSEIH